MADHAWLVGRLSPSPTFWSSPADEEIAYAVDWVPIGWLALFEAPDVALLTEPVEKPGTTRPSFVALQADEVEPATCATLIRNRQSALDVFKARSERLAKMLPASLAPQLQGLQAAVENAKSPYIQVLVTDIDVYISYGESEKMLRDFVATIDGNDLDRWRAMLSFVHATLGARLTDMRFPRGVEVAALVGYLPEKFVVPYDEVSGDPSASDRKNRRSWWRFW